jgi:poly(3-hydroxybutyrate) depolymerase
MHRCFLLGLALFGAVSLSAQAKFRDVLMAKAPDGFVEKTWTVDGVKRTALLRVPASVAGQVAVVFCWHGHGGRSTAAAGKLS